MCPLPVFVTAHLSETEVQRERLLMIAEVVERLIEGWMHATEEERRNDRTGAGRRLFCHAVQELRRRIDHLLDISTTRVAVTAQDSLTDFPA